MLNLDDLKKDTKLINAINWEMTPEEAIRLYLEWGNNWTRGNYVIRSKNDVAHYFAISTWKNPPIIYLIRRNSEEAVDLAEITMPDDLKEHFLESVGHNKGVYTLTDKLRDWLKSELNA